MAKDKYPTVQLVEGNGHPLVKKKILPNSPCPCGSRKKAKHCCGAKTTYFYSKLNEKQERDRKLQQEAEAKQNQHTTEG